MRDLIRPSNGQIIVPLLRSNRLSENTNGPACARLTCTIYAPQLPKQHQVTDAVSARGIASKVLSISQTSGVDVYTAFGP